MHQELLQIINKFKNWEIIAPLLLDDNSICEIINYLNNSSLTNINQIDEEWFSNVFVFKTEDKNFKIEKTREIIEKASIKPAWDFNIFLIQEIDKFTEQAWNSLLKTFEDIPNRILFLLTTNSKENILETIESRILNFSYNSFIFNLDEDVKLKIDNFFNWNKEDFISFIYNAKLQKNEYLNIIIYFKNKALEWYINDLNILQKIENGIKNIYSTNANAKWILDDIILSL